VPERGDCGGGDLNGFLALLLTHDFLLGFGAGIAAVYALSVTVVLLLLNAVEEAEGTLDKS